MLRIRLLGDLAVDVGGEPRTLPPGRAAALLGWLALNPGLHPRGRVAPLLWPDVLDSSARASLRTAVWELRRSLASAGELLIATRDRVGLADSGEVWVDVREVDELRQSGRLDEALELCAGELLPGVEAEWLDAARSDHRSRVLDLLADLADEAGSTGDEARAAALAGRAAALDPLSEELHRAWIQRLAGAGDRAAALSAHAAFRSRLLATLRIPPSEETEQLVRELRAAGGTGPQASAESAAPVEGADDLRAGQGRLPARLRRAERAPFVGRGAELERLRTVWRRVIAGADSPQIVLLSGEPGIGKTRLAARLAVGAGADGAFVLFGSATEEALVPYEALAEALEDWVLSSSESAAPQDDDGADVHLLRLYSAAEAQLARLAESAPVLLILDDLHWADRGTLAILTHLARVPFAERICFVITYRESELAGHALAPTLDDLRREGEVDRIRLDGLAKADVADLVAETGGPDLAEHAASIHERTGGNPFFVRELARHVLESDADDVDRPEVPEEITELVSARVGRLGAPCANALAAGSVLGDEFELRVLGDLIAPAPTLLDELDRAIHAGLVEEAAAGRYRFTHALVRESLYGGMSRSRRAHLHALAAQSLDRMHAGDGPHLIEIALHLCDAAADGDHEPAVTAAVRAAEWAHGRHAYEQAIVLYTRALRLLEPDDDRRRHFTIRRAIAVQRLQHILIDAAQQPS